MSLRSSINPPGWDESKKNTLDLHGEERERDREREVDPPPPTTMIQETTTNDARRKRKRLPAGDDPFLHIY